MKIRYTERIRDLLRIKTNCYNELIDGDEDFTIYGSKSKVVAIYNSFDHTSLGKLKILLDKIDSVDKYLYIFTFDDEAIDLQEFEDWNGVKVEPIPQRVLETLESAYV